MCPDDAADLFRYDLFTKQREKFGTFLFVVAQPFKLPGLTSIHWRRETRHSAFARLSKRLCVLIGSRLKRVFGDKKTITSGAV